MLEAVYLLARGRSFRSGRTSSLIRRGSEELSVSIRGSDVHRGQVQLSLQRDAGGRTRLRLDGQRERRLSALAARIPLQLFLPDVSTLVFGSPAERRQWLDWGLFHVEPTYLSVLQRMQQALKQRNAALKGGRSGNDDLQIWTDAFCDRAEIVTQLRRDYVARLRGHLDQALSSLAPELEAQVQLYAGWSAQTPLPKILSEQRDSEVKSGITLSGPQRADLRLHCGKQPAASVLSRGQGKMLAMALKIAQAALLSESTNARSLFLIDDVGAELDSRHGARFFELLSGSGCQILATTTQNLSLMDRTGTDTRRFHVEQGRIERS